MCLCLEEPAPGLGPFFIPATCAKTDRQEIPVYILNFPYPSSPSPPPPSPPPRSAASWPPAQACSECQRFISSLWRCHATLPMPSPLRVSVCLRVCDVATLEIQQYDNTPRLPASWFSAPWPGSNIPSVEEENRFLAGPCLLHPTHCRLFKCVGLFIRQTSHFHVLSLLDSTRAVCVGTQWRTVPALLMCLLPLSALDKHESSPRTQPGC
jgi:hypothetical protein